MGTRRPNPHDTPPAVRIAILVPVLDEEAALPAVLAGLAGRGRIVVCDNGSTDRSAEFARAAGAEVVPWPIPGYGGAVKAGLAHLRADPPEVVVVFDGDHSCYAEDLDALLAPIAAGTADMVLGDRTALAEAGALYPQQRWGNALAVRLIQARTGHRYRDMGPLRAIRWDSLLTLHMEDPTWGWNVEMQIKAIRRGLRVAELPVRTRPRIGRSKISGTVRGVLKAGARITWACWKYG
jgi:glycosyltransferase involved in cell wall biosynthesis